MEYKEIPNAQGSKVQAKSQGMLNPKPQTAHLWLRIYGAQGFYMPGFLLGASGRYNPVITKLRSMV